MINSISLQLQGGDNHLPRKVNIIAEFDDHDRAGIEHTTVFSAWIEGEPAGFFAFTEDKTHWEYNGDVLSIEEEGEIAQFIQQYKAADREP